MRTARFVLTVTAFAIAGRTSGTPAPVRAIDVRTASAAVSMALAPPAGTFLGIVQRIDGRDILIAGRGDCKLSRHRMTEGGSPQQGDTVRVDFVGGRGEARVSRALAQTADAAR